MDIALLGPSGAGKGTHVDDLVAEFGLIHVAPGNIFRQNLENQTDLGLTAQRYMQRGELVPDNIVDAMVEAHIRAVSPTQAILFDGFPATLEQAHFLDGVFDEIGRRLSLVLYLDVYDDVLEKQIAGRLVCRRCQRPFHEAYHPFKQCPHQQCAGEFLYRREDDAPEVARTRLNTYYHKTAPVVELYHGQGKLVVIDGNGMINWVRDDLIETIKSETQFLGESVKSPETPETGQIEALKKSQAIIPTEDEAWPSMNIVLFGVPGSGKGTQADKLGQHFSLPHITTGDLFRENLSQGTGLGTLARFYMNQGELVPDDVTEGMVQNRLADTDTADGFILDGFPRTSHQAKALMRMLADRNRRVSGVLYLQVPDEEIIQRLSSRLTCRDCQAIYHEKFNPPAEANTCDQCGGTLYRRDDDQPETIRNRLHTFHRQTEPLLDFYRQAGLLIEVDGEGPIVVVTNRMLDVMEALDRRKAVVSVQPWR